MKLLCAHCLTLEDKAKNKIQAESGLSLCGNCGEISWVMEIQPGLYEARAMTEEEFTYFRRDIETFRLFNYLRLSLSME